MLGLAVQRRVGSCLPGASWAFLANSRYWERGNAGGSPIRSNRTPDRSSPPVKDVSRVQYPAAAISSDRVTASVVTIVKLPDVSVLIVGASPKVRDAPGIGVPCGAARTWPPTAQLVGA